MTLIIINRIVAVLIILANLYLLPVNYATIRSQGLKELGFFSLLIMFGTHLLLITAAMTFIKGGGNNGWLLLINAIGLLVILVFYGFVGL